MENKLEQLLNSLIEKGWCPFGINYYCSFNIRERIEIIGGPFGGGEYILDRITSLRELVSKESGLWQFVCENGLLEYDADILDKKVKEIGGDMRCTRYEKHYKIVNTDYGTQSMFRYESPEYRLIESSLKDESELEEFLLQNIKLGNED